MKNHWKNTLFYVYLKYMCDAHNIYIWLNGVMPYGVIKLPLRSINYITQSLVPAMEILPLSCWSRSPRHSPTPSWSLLGLEDRIKSWRHHTLRHNIRFGGMKVELDLKASTKRTSFYSLRYSIQSPKEKSDE